jgi:hypothetical protein
VVVARVSFSRDPESGCHPGPAGPG